MLMICFILYCYPFFFIVHLLRAEYPQQDGVQIYWALFKHKDKQHLLHCRACDQNHQDKAWKHREYLKYKVISFAFVLKKCSSSLAAQIFPPTSLSNLIFWESWNYHVLACKERLFMSCSNHSQLKWAMKLGSEHSGSDGYYYPRSNSVLFMLTWLAQRQTAYLPDTFMLLDNPSDIVKHGTGCVVSDQTTWFLSKGFCKEDSCISPGNLWRQLQSLGSHNAFAKFQRTECRLIGCWWEARSLVLFQQA